MIPFARRIVRSAPALWMISFSTHLLRGPPAQDRPACSCDFIEPRNARRMRSGFDDFRILLHFLRDRAHRIDKQIEFFERFTLRRLDHQRPMDDKREAYRVGMEAVIDEALSDVAGLHAF